MKTLAKVGLVSAVVLSLSACGNLSTRDKSTIGGAAVGGVIGNQVGK